MYRDSLHRPDTHHHTPVSLLSAELSVQTAGSPCLGLTQAELRRKEPHVPKFYFPEGRPDAKPNMDDLISNIKKTFSLFPHKRATMEDMGQVAKACECPLYWKGPLFCAAGGSQTGFVTVREFVAMWQTTLQTCQDDASRFVHLLAKPECNYLQQEDFVPFLQDVVRTHASLAFLEEDADNKSQYITTVIQRIFYTVNRSWSGKITCPELRKSNFLECVSLLEQIEDTNQLSEFFPYDHFYVICYKFFELDTDSDTFINQWDLARHNNQAISLRMIERIFSGAVTRGEQVCKEGKMSFADFVWFLISEEDKQTDTSVEYWFRCMDLDGDGVLSMYELEFLYEGQCHMLKNSNFEPRPFEDLICELLDLVKPEVEGKITLRDLKRCKLAHVFFDTFINIYKYLDREQNDPYCTTSDKAVPELSDWERYVEMECENLVANQAEDDDDSPDEQQQQQQQSSSESVIDELVSAVKTL
ncbi:serine/threonine-protein phosphatase 2A regulatory subunit B'' subunit beta isoform X2 [Genypterus blacodes]|uniref:serine/threonine-protein phosphatase 2A regulatory subunit B'' subunit beta isoform X2 n=1 Tax=Genypterus blacodes TaxID=154954 RepID=UPI003F75C02E